MEPLLLNEDKVMFYKYLDKATNYFEFGAGGSTYQASLRSNIQTIHSVESDASWVEKVRANIKHSNTNIIYCDLDTANTSLGYPGVNCLVSNIIKYSSAMVTLDPKISSDIDFVLIDGRFRVASCLKCYDILKDTCLIAFDDFWPRPHYHIVLDFFEVVESTTNHHMVVLRKKPKRSPSKELIELYEKDPR